MCLVGWVGRPDAVCGAGRGEVRADSMTVAHPCHPRNPWTAPWVAGRRPQRVAGRLIAQNPDNTKCLLHNSLSGFRPPPWEAPGVDSVDRINQDARPPRRGFTMAGCRFRRAGLIVRSSVRPLSL